MPKHTDSCIIDHHEDGSKTVTTIETVYPATKKQQIAVFGGLTLVALAPLVPILFMAGAEKWQEKREARKALKNTETPDND